MYSTCLFCTRPLGRNEAVESFPVGRRLAFDGGKGRLWVVCPSCERWNLTPLEQRWEAIEQAERLYRSTHRRVATDNIGLARTRDGTDLIRIGRPRRPEMAAWRYGDTFGRRRRRRIVHGVVAAGGTAAAVAALPAGAASIVLAGVFGSLAYVAPLAVAGLLRVRTFRRHWVSDGEGRFLIVGPHELPHIRLAPAAEAVGGWALRIPYADQRATTDLHLRDFINAPLTTGERTLTGAPALEAARRILPLVNGAGAKERDVHLAVKALEAWSPERTFARAASEVRAWSARQWFGDTGALQHLPRTARLALEMAANEERERHALETELARLERAWREAEEIAAIADALLLPEGIQEKVDRLRAPSSEGPDRGSPARRSGESG